MFRIFDRYLGRQILVSTFFAVAVLSVVLVLGQIFKKLLDKLVEGTLPPEAILKFIGYSFPWSLSFTVPWGILTAVLLVFGRLSADNELIALRMSGQSLRRICAPVFALALAASGLCFWINTTVAPHSFSEIRRTTQQTVLNDPKAIFRPDTLVDDLTGFFIFAEAKEGEKMKNLQIIMLQEDRVGDRARPAKYFFSREAEIESGNVFKTKQIMLNLTDNFSMFRNWPSEASAEELKAMSAEQLAAYNEQLRGEKEGMPDVAPAATSYSGLPVSLQKMFDKNSKMRVDGMSMSQLVTGLRNPAELAVDGSIPPSHSGMLTELNRRLSFSLACFVLAFVAIPFGITAQRRETSAGFVLSLIVGITYFALIMLGGIWQDSPDKYPHLWVWLPNVIFGILGAVMFLRLQKR
jgi:lipopolysaccharide export LptBFGC system permease protein LptF